MNPELLRGKRVRLALHRIDCDDYRGFVTTLAGRPCTLTDDQVRASVIEHAAKLGWTDGDIGKVVMVSRLGDCGLAKDLSATHGYTLRVTPECLEVIS